MIRALALVASLALAGCALQPLYSGGSSGPVATTLSQVTVATIPGRDGWLMYNALKDRFPGEGSNAAYLLEVDLDDDIIGLGIRGDRAVTRERRILRARYRLIELATGQVVLDATAGADAGIDVVSSEYATVAAEQTALENLTKSVADQIIERIATFASRSAQVR